MIEEFDIWETGISFYLFLNWFFCLSVTLWIGYLFHARRHLFLKPSILLLSYSCIFYQWPLAIYAGYYEYFLPDPFAFAFLIHAYVLIGFLFSSFALDKKTRIIWERVAIRDLDIFEVNNSVLIILSFIILSVTIYYFMIVPFSETGLYAILYHPKGSVLAREKSLKLLESGTLKYAYSIMVSAIAPLTAVIFFFAILKSFKKWKIGKALFLCLPLLGLAIVISLPGARISVVNLLLVVTIAFLYYRGIPFRPLHFFLIIILILLLPTILSILREGKNVSLSAVVSYFGYIFRRTFLLTMDVGSWYAHHFQTVGAFGVAGVPKLADLLGMHSLNTPNFIALKYMSGALPSSSAVAGYLFTYYSYFGFLSLVISLTGLWLLDMAILIYDRLSQFFLLPCIASITVSSLSFLSSDYTTVLLTHGFGVILIVSLLIDKIRAWISAVQII